MEDTHRNLDDLSPAEGDYEPPRVDDLSAEDGPTLTAPGIVKSPPPPGPEWRA